MELFKRLASQVNFVAVRLRSRCSYRRYCVPRPYVELKNCGFNCWIRKIAKNQLWKLQWNYYCAFALRRSKSIEMKNRIYLLVHKPKYVVVAVCFFGAFHYFVRFFFLVCCVLRFCFFQLFSFRLCREWLANGHLSVHVCAYSTHSPCSCNIFYCCSLWMMRTRFPFCLLDWSVVK